MSFKTVCPNCDAELTAPDTVLDKRVKCKKCGDPFTAKRAVDDDDEDDRPAKASTKARLKPDRDDDDDAPPRKSAKARRAADDDEDDEDEDEEPRPKAKKKGKKKKKQGLPLAVVLAVIGGVLLIGGAVVAYFGFIKEDKPTDPVVAKGEGGPPTERGKARGGPGGGPQGQPSWFEHVDAEGKYRIKFPKQPSVQNQTVNVGNMQQMIKAMIAQTGPETFVSNFIPLPPEQANIDPKIILDAAEQQAANQIPGGATITSKKDVTQGGVSGRELTLSLQGGVATGIVRLFITNGRVYTVAAVGPGLQASSPNVTTFFDSLKFDS
ncbi:MAG TPA: hypothetical protein VHR66_14355 [Gemmataceae bacterium]|jgi:flagellar basal body-associated protein FliL|nr:hypothetical protein [Gemmataceae bacterium]